LDIISEAVGRLSHESRNILQRIQIRLASLNKSLNLDDSQDHDIKKLHLEFKAIHRQVETTKWICDPIVLNRELVCISDCIEETWQELNHASDHKTEAELLIRPDVLVWIDLAQIKIGFKSCFNTCSQLLNRRR
jgi:hypothetical protein